MTSLVQASDYVELNTGPYVATCTFPNPTTVGNTLVALVRNNYTSIPTPPGWTAVGTQWAGTSAPGGNASAGLFYKPATGSSTETLEDFGHWFTLAMVELDGSIDSIVVDTSTATGAVCTTDVTAGAGVYVVVFAVNEADSHGSGTITVPTTPPGLTEVFYDAPGSGTYQYPGWGGYASVSAGTSSSTISASISNQKIGGVAAVFVTASEPPPDPEPGGVLDPPGEIDADPVPITDDIVEWTIRRGAAEQVTGAAPIGSATVKLRNTDNKYNPENGSSPLIAYLRDGTAIHIAVNKTDGLLTGTEPAGLFGGRITDITPIPMGGQDTAPFVEFQCEDALGWLGRTPITVGFAVGRSQGSLREAILTNAAETRTDLAHEILTMPLSSGEGNALALLEELNKSNGTRHFVRPATAALDWYTYVTYNRQHGLDASSDATLTDSDILVSGIAGWRLSADTVVNQQRATVTPIRFTPSTYPVWVADPLPVVVTPTRPFEVWVDFDDYVRAPTVNSAYTGTTPVITLTPFGTTAKLTITVASSSCTFTALSIEGALARRLPPQSWVADDLTSQVLPRGIRSGSEISGEYVGTLSCARGIAEHVVWRYATPLTRPTLTIANWFPEMFDLDLGDIITITFDALGVTAQRFEIVGLTHRGVFITTNRSLHTVEYVLQKSRAQTDPDFFVLDADELDDIPVLAY